MLTCYGLAWLAVPMTDTDTPQVHIRVGELASSVAVAANKLAEAGKLDVRTYWSHGADGMSNRVAVKEVMWTAGTVPTLVFVLENGQEFEAIVQPSNRAIRDARNVLDAVTQRAELDQDEQRRIADLLKSEQG